MAKVKVVLNPRAVRWYLQGGGGVREACLDAAQRIAAAGGEGMEVDGEVGPNRFRASVRTATIDAMKAEAQNRTLSAALDAGR